MVKLLTQKVEARGLWRILAIPEKVPGLKILDANAKDMFRRDCGINRMESAAACIFFWPVESIG
jgi:hypothetical protein